MKHAEAATAAQRVYRARRAEVDTHVAYAIGRIEAWLEIYARGIPISGAELTHRVASSLLSQAGEILGTPSPLSTLLGGSTSGSEAVEPVAVARGPHRNAQDRRGGRGRKLSAAARKRISQRMKQSWAERKKAQAAR